MKGQGRLDVLQVTVLSDTLLCLLVDTTREGSRKVGCSTSQGLG